MTEADRLTSALAELRDTGYDLLPTCQADGLVKRPGREGHVLLRVTGAGLELNSAHTQVWVPVSAADLAGAVRKELGRF